MNSSDIQNRTNDQPGLGGAQLSESAASRPSPFPLFTTLIACMTIALAAGFIAWGVSEKLRVREIVRLDVKVGGTTLSPPRAMRNGAVAYGILGGLLGLGLGVISSALVARKPTSKIALAGLSGLALGSIAGAASSYALFPPYFSDLEKTDLTLSFLIHVGIWGAIGAGVGLAFAFGLADRSRLAQSLVGGIFGGAIGAVILDLVGSFFPLAHTERPLSEESATRLVAALLLAVFVAVGTVFVASQEARRPAKTT